MAFTSSLACSVMSAQINYQPCSRKQVESLMHRAWIVLLRAISSHQQSSAYLTKGNPQLDKPLGQTGQTLMACTVAEGF